MAEAHKPQLPDLFENLPRRGVSENDVWRAADALLLEGRRPTIEAVRRYLGGGSPNTVTPYLDTWYKGLGKRLQDPRAFAAPAGIPEPIAAAAAHFWESALSVARGELESNREALTQAQESLARDRAELEARAERMAAAEAAMNEALILAKEQLANAVMRGDRLVKRNDTLEIEIAALKAQLQASREELEVERRDRAADAKQALETVAAERERFEANERHWIKETDAARGAARTATEERDVAMKAASEARRRLEAELEARRGEMAILQAQLAESRRLTDTTLGELERATQAHGDAQQQLAEAAARHTRELEHQRDQFSEALRTLGRSLAAVRLQASVGAPAS